VNDRVASEWWLLASAAVGGGGALVYLLSRFMFASGTIIDLEKHAVSAGVVAGCFVGLVCGVVGPATVARKYVGLAAAPFAVFGILVLPGVLEGHWKGVAIWWLAAATLFACGWTVAHVTARVKSRTRGS
jgi:hypothetical protein